MIIIFIIYQIFVLTSCSYAKFKTKKQTINESVKNVLSIKELIPQKIVAVKILPNKIPSEFWFIANNTNQQSLISEALEYGIITIGEQYNIHAVVSIIYHSKNGSYTGGFILMVEPKIDSSSKRRIATLD